MASLPPHSLPHTPALITPPCSASSLQEQNPFKETHVSGTSLPLPLSFKYIHSYSQANTTVREKKNTQPPFGYQTWRCIRNERCSVPAICLWFCNGVFFTHSDFYRTLVTSLLCKSSSVLQPKHIYSCVGCPFLQLQLPVLPTLSKCCPCYWNNIVASTSR